MCGIKDSQASYHIRREANRYCIFCMCVCVLVAMACFSILSCVLSYGIKANLTLYSELKKTKKFWLYSREATLYSIYA